MSEKELTTLLRSHLQRSNKRGWRCPDENQLAAYWSGHNSEKRRKRETHFSNCKFCLEALAFMVETVDEPSLESVPPQLLSRARSLPDEKPTGFSRWRWATTMSVATACLLLVFAVVIWKIRSTSVSTPSPDFVTQKIEPPRPADLRPSNAEVSQTPVNLPAQKPKSLESPVPAVRGENHQLKPTLIFPRDGSLMPATQQVVRWEPVPDASFYEVRVVTADGGQVLKERTSSTEFSIGALAAGGKFFITVEAHFSGNRTTKSELVSFRVAAK